MPVACRKVLVTDVNEPLTSERIAEMRAYMKRRLLEGQKRRNRCNRRRPSVTKSVDQIDLFTT
jgi:hypothetical protein